MRPTISTLSLIAVLAAATLPAASATPAPTATDDGGRMVVPDTLTGTPVWQTAGRTVASAGAMGVVVGETTSSGVRYSLVRLDGSRAWTSAPAARDADVYWIGQDSGQPWLVTVEQGKDASTLQVFNGLSSGTLDSVNTVVTDVPVTVSASEDALLLRGADGKVWVFDPLGTGPGTLLTPHEGSSYVAWMDGAVLVNDDVGVAVWAPGGSWTATDTHPEGVDPATGRFLAWGDGLTVTTWTGKGKNVIAIQDAASGRILGAGPVDKDTAATCTHLVIDDESEWAGCGAYVFNLTTGDTAVLNIDNEHITAIHDRVAYTATTKDLPGRALDVRTGDPVGRELDFTAIPATFTTAGAILTTGENTYLIKAKNQ